MINLLIVGISGKMGKKVYQKAKEYGLNVLCGVDKNVGGNFDCPVYRSFDEVKENIDLVIDFSSPDVSDDLYRFVKENRCGLFSGTTGYTGKEEHAPKKLSRYAPVFLASNTSHGVNLLIKLVKLACKNIDKCEIEIIEKHHKNKKDAPSGTALSIKKAIKESINYDATVHSVRGGNIVGEHEVLFMCGNEIISIKHEAISDEVFAEGAIKAAIFLTGKKPGLYTMDDLLRE